MPRIRTLAARCAEIGWQLDFLLPGWLTLALMPQLRERFAAYSAAELSARFEKIGLPYAPITKPQDLFNDPHLLATGGLSPVRVPADASGAGREIDTRTALLPLSLAGQRLPVRSAPPRLGQDTRSLLQSLGYADAVINTLIQQGTVKAAVATD